MQFDYKENFFDFAMEKTYNVIIGRLYLDPKDIFHSECYPIFERLLGFEVEALCPVIVLVETICALRRIKKAVYWEIYCLAVSL